MPSFDVETFLSRLIALTPQPDPEIAAAESLAYAVGLVAQQLGEVADAIRESTEFRVGA